MFLEISFCLTIFYLIWDFVKRKHEKYEKDGVPHRKPVWLLGNTWRAILRKRHVVEDIVDFYKEGDGKKYFGVYSLLVPVLMIRDPQLIKQITVKDFDFFPDHQSGDESQQTDELIGKSLISLKGQKWKDMRAALSPLFTSSKIRDMCIFVSECGEQMTAYLRKECDGNGNQSTEVELKELSNRFMTDVIASTVFGIKTDSFTEKDNEFFTLGRKLTNFGAWVFVKAIFVTLFPKLAKLLKIQFFSEKINNFFRQLVLGGMKYREENNIVRRDMIQLLMEAKQGSIKHENSENTTKDAGFATVEESDIGMKNLKRAWVDDDLVAQSMLFFFAGFETASVLVSFLIYELALNPEVQEKLQREIDESVHQNGFTVNYKMLQDLKYLDMVVSEALRLWPPGIVGDRMCVKDVDIGPVVDGQRTSYTVNENKHNIKPFTYLPFGAGPRNCIGSRFALMESKVFVYHLIARFNVEVCAKTSIPLKLDKSSFSLKPENGFCVKLVTRNNGL